MRSGTASAPAVLSGFLCEVLRYYRDLALVPVRIVRNEWASLQAALDDDELSACDAPFCDCRCCA